MDLIIFSATIVIWCAKSCNMRHHVFSIRLKQEELERQEEEEMERLDREAQEAALREMAELDAQLMVRYFTWSNFAF